MQLDSQNKIKYSIRNPQTQQTEVLGSDDTLHFVGMSENGLTGVSRIHYNARDAIALARTLQTAAGLAHENAVKPSISIEIPQGMNEKAKKGFINYITARYAGRDNIGKPMFLDSGVKITPLDIPLDDLTTIAALRLSIADISRFYGVPLALLNESEGTTSWGTGVDSLIRGFLTFTLDPELHRIEAELNSKLFGDTGDENYAMFDRESLLQMDAVSAAQAESAQINSGVLLINEARFRKHRPPTEGGDVALVNSTLVPLTRAVAPPQPSPFAAPPTDPAGKPEPASDTDPDSDGDDDAPGSTNDPDKEADAQAPTTATPKDTSHD